MQLMHLGNMIGIPYSALVRWIGGRENVRFAEPAGAGQPPEPVPPA